MDVCSGSAFGDPCRPNHDGKHWKPASKATLTPGNLKQSTPQLRPLHLGLLEHLKGVVTTTSQPETDWILQKDAVWPKKHRKSRPTGRKNHRKSKTWMEIETQPIVSKFQKPLYNSMPQGPPCSPCLVPTRCWLSNAKPRKWAQLPWKFVSKVVANRK